MVEMLFISNNLNEYDLLWNTRNITGTGSTRKILVSEKKRFSEIKLIFFKWKQIIWF